MMKIILNPVLISVSVVVGIFLSIGILIRVISNINNDHGIDNCSRIYY